MLKEHEGNIIFDETHLFEPEIKTIEGIGERYKNLDMSLLIHVVSDPSCRYESKFGKGRISPKFSGMNARDRLLSILATKSMTGNPKGYYVNKHKSGVQAEINNEIKSVSFSFCNIKDIPLHFSARGSKYGIVFFHDFLANRGIKKVTYINDQNPLELRTLLFNLPYLIESYGKGYDMRWENEWRIKGNLTFEKEDIAFIIVPDNDYDDFLDKVDDYYIIPSSLFDDQIKYFLTLHTYENSYWNQIRILGGMLVDIDMFPVPTEEELELIEGECGEWIEYLCKAGVQEKYEERYINRFQSFINRIDESHLGVSFLNGLKNVSCNANEPRQTHRDLMMHCYGIRFNIQKERIDIF